MNTLYQLTAMFRTGAAQKTAVLLADWNEHLSQRSPRVKMAGRLFDPSGEPLGWTAIIDADDLKQAQRYADDSPFREADLYLSLSVNRIEIEVGSLG